MDSRDEMPLLFAGGRLKKSCVIMTYSDGHESELHFPIEIISIELSRFAKSTGTMSM